ncbi:MAG TPA: hypothetical protein VN714_07020 [Trebonia sp.]|nr:hypothetical protein [Trebonia sp.]
MGVAVRPTLLGDEGWPLVSAGAARILGAVRSTGSPLSVNG